MSKRLVLYLILSFLSVFSASPVAFQDFSGHIVEVGVHDRVACLNSSLADIWKLAGGEVAITVGDAVEKGFAPEDAFLVDGGSGMKIDFELLFYSRPDFVLASLDTASHVQAVKRMTDAGIPAALMRLECFEDFYHVFSILTGITGREDLFEKYAEGQKQEIEDIIDSVKSVGVESSVLFIRAGSGFSSTRAKKSDEHFAARILSDLGVHNIADDAPVLSEGLSLEAVLVNDPDYILIVPQGDEEASIAYMQELLKRAGWKNLSAVKGGRVFFLPKDLFHYKPNARWAEAYAFMAKILFQEEESDEE